MLRVLEDESRFAAQKPRVMKKFSETRKAEKVVANPKSERKLTPPVNEVEEEDKELLVMEKNDGSTNASPRNKALAKLGTRGKGGGRPRKTNSAATKKNKE